MRVIVGTVVPKHPSGYDIPELESGERYRGALWRRVVKPGLSNIQDIETPWSSEWRYVNREDDG